MNFVNKKHIYFLRHAKAEKGWPGLADIDRPLHPLGIEEAHKVAKIYASSTPIPDLVICSPSVRTYSTAMIFCRCVGFNLSDIQLDERIYNASLMDLWEVISEINEKYSSVLIVGHNPSMTEISNAFNNGIQHMKTGSLYGFSNQNQFWTELDGSESVMIRTIEP